MPGPHVSPLTSTDVSTVCSDGSGVVVASKGQASGSSRRRARDPPPRAGRSVRRDRRAARGRRAPRRGGNGVDRGCDRLERQARRAWRSRRHGRRVSWARTARDTRGGIRRGGPGEADESGSQAGTDLPGLHPRPLELELRRAAQGATIVARPEESEDPSSGRSIRVNRPGSTHFARPRLRLSPGPLGAAQASVGDGVDGPPYARRERSAGPEERTRGAFRTREGRIHGQGRQHHRHRYFEEQLVKDLELLGYDVWWKVVDFSGFGLPQRRHRLVLIVSHDVEAPRLDPGDHVETRTVRDAIKNLPHISAGGAIRKMRCTTRQV